VIFAPEISYHYDNGSNPSVAMSDSTVVEVHNGANGQMWYHLGTVTGSTVNWGPSYYYDNGSNPSVAMASYNPSLGLDPIVVEVHNGANGQMWYHLGTVTGSTVNWGPSYYYDNGSNPKVGYQEGYQYGFGVVASLIEVHNGANGQMWYHVGFLGQSSITWGPAYQHDDGFNPSVAITPDGLTAIEVLNAPDGNGNMWYHEGTFQERGIIP
jgi:hypothetical protein